MLLAELSKIRQAVEGAATQKQALASEHDHPSRNRFLRSQQGEDVGEVVSRPPQAALASTSLEAPLETSVLPRNDSPEPAHLSFGVDSEPANVSSAPSTKRPSRRKRKGRNPIDDLFMSLE